MKNVSCEANHQLCVTPPPKGNPVRVCQHAPLEHYDQTYIRSVGTLINKTVLKFMPILHNNITKLGHTHGSERREQDGTTATAD